jgi:hypothetical protein
MIFRYVHEGNDVTQSKAHPLVQGVTPSEPWLRMDSRVKSGNDKMKDHSRERIRAPWMGHNLASSGRRSPQESTYDTANVGFYSETLPSERRCALRNG